MPTIFEPQHINNSWCPGISINIGTWLEQAENLYGERDRDFTFLGVELVETLYPFIYFYKLANNFKNFTVRIPVSDLNNLTMAQFHVAQEIIHFLNPENQNTTPANYLEEGLATHFAIQVLGSSNLFTNPSKHLVAKGFIDQLFLKTPNTIITKLRQQIGSLSKVTPQMILTHSNNKVNQQLANDLCKPF